MDNIRFSPIDQQLRFGQVKTVTSAHGTKVDYAELLFGENTKAQFVAGDSGIQFVVSDVNLDLNKLSCDMSKETLRDLIVVLKDMYNQA